LDDFGSTKATVAKSGSNTLNIILVSIGGIVVVGITTLNIIAAAAVAIIRMIMLIFLLAFSPIWVASWGMPALKEFSKTWTGQFYAQLIFLPVYLAFLYVALRIVTESKLNSVTTAADSTSIANVLNLFVGFGIVIVMLTIPMIAALAVTKALGGNSGIIEKWSNTARSWVGKNTYGRAAARINESNVMRNMYANNPRLGRAVSSGFSKISSNSFSADKKDKNKGFDQVRKGQIEDRTKFISGLGYDDQRVKDQKESYQKDEISKYNADLLTRTNSIEQIKNRIAHTSDPEAKAKYEKLLEQRTKELNTLRENRDKTIKEKTDVEEKRLKDERKETATKVYEKKSFGMGPSKFNKAVAASVRKGKMPADEIMEALKKLKDNEEKSGDKDKGGGSKDEDKKGK
jgi:signal transduction histidine kinase